MVTEDKMPQPITVQINSAHRADMVLPQNEPIICMIFCTERIP